MATCGLCGGGLVVESRRQETRSDSGIHLSPASCQQQLYQCAPRVRGGDERGRAAGLRGHALTPEAIEKVITLTEQDDAAHHLDAIQKEANDIAKRLARITEAIETSGDIRSLVARIPELEERQQVIASERCPKLR